MQQRHPRSTVAHEQYGMQEPQQQQATHYDNSVNSSLARDPISLILSFLPLKELATSAVLISRVWYLTAQTIRSRKDDIALYDLSPLNESGQASTSTTTASASASSTSEGQLLLQSSLRHHVTSLLVVFNESRRPPRGVNIQDIFAPRLSVPLTRSTFTTRMNAIAQAMPHLIDLTCSAQMDMKDEEEKSLQEQQQEQEQEQEQVLSLPRDLRRLTLSFTFTAIAYGGTKSSDAWLTDLFHDIATGASQLRILHCHMVASVGIPPSAVAQLSAAKELKRLSLGTFVRYAHDPPFLDAIRAIPKLADYVGPDEGSSEYSGPHHSRTAYLLRSPSIQSYTRIGNTRANSWAFITQDGVQEFEGMPALTPSCLLASPSRHSLTELNAIISSSLGFLSQLSRLRVLQMQISAVPPFIGVDLPGSVDTAQDTVHAVSQCRLLERLQINWVSLMPPFTESHVEAIVAPLVNLNYLVLDGQHQVRSLDFLTRSIHLINGLKYFSFCGRLHSLDSYRAIYSLSQLRLLHIVLRDPVSLMDSLSLRRGPGGAIIPISSFSIDAMFRPHHQVGTTGTAKAVIWRDKFPGLGGWSSDVSAFASTAVPVPSAGGSIWSSLGSVSTGVSLGTAATPAPAASAEGSLDCVVASPSPSPSTSAVCLSSSSSSSGADGFGISGITDLSGLTFPGAPQVDTSAPRSDEGQLPPEYLTHLRHFSQHLHREQVPEWMALIEEIDKARVQQIMQEE